MADEEGNLLSIDSKEHDLSRIALLAAEARSLGFPEGKAVWKHGYRKITDAEYDLQMERLEQGLDPDPAEEYLNAVERNVRK